MGKPKTTTTTTTTNTAEEDQPLIKDSAFLKNVALGFCPGTAFADKDAFLDAVFGVKLVLSIIMGVAWGIIPLTGATGFIAYGVAICAIMLAYAKGLMRDEDCEPTEIFTEGFLPSFAIFLVTWTASYSTLHP